MFDYDFMPEEKAEEVVLVDSLGMTPRQANMLEIAAIAEAHCFTVEDILGKRKFKPFVTVRRKCIVMLREKATRPQRLVGLCSATTALFVMRCKRARQSHDTRKAKAGS